MTSDRLTEQKDWRGEFDSRTLKYGQDIYEKGGVISFAHDITRAQASVIAASKFYSVMIDRAPFSYSMNWNTQYFSCSCRPKRRSSYYPHFYNQPCEHMAAALFYWEKKHGPWIFTESDEEYAARMKREQEEDEKARLEAIRKKEEAISVKVSDFLSERRPQTGGTYFDIKAAMKDYSTNLYAVHVADAIMNTDDPIDVHTSEVRYGMYGNQEFIINAYVNDLASDFRRNVYMTFSRNRLINTSCFCNHSYYQNSLPLCAHQLVLLLKAYDYIEENDPGDATDRSAGAFFEAMESFGQSIVGNEEKAVVKKSVNVMLRPLLNIDGSSVILSFKVGNIGQKQLQLKKIEQFASAVQDESTFAASKTVIFDFSKQDFDKESKPWLNFILQKVSDTGQINNRLEQKNRWYYYTPSIKTDNKDELSGSILDRFYDIAEGMDCDVVKKNRGTKESPHMHIGHHNMKVTISTKPLKAANGDFLGITVYGSMPMIRMGSVDGYIIGDDYISKISKEEQNVLLPFMKAADDKGNICFNVGKDKLTEFYYRVVPTITEQSYIEFEDTCSEAAALVMPPEPVFTFTFDTIGDYFTCTEKVSYDGIETTLPRNEVKDKRIDAVQEKRATDALKKYFPDYIPNRKMFVTKATEENLFSILTEGITKLSSFGMVLGTDAFKLNRIKRPPQVSVGVSVESGIMDLSVISKDVDPEELLGILESYKLKKKYYKLKSGDYVELSQNEQFDSLTDVADNMNLPLEELITKGAKLPAFRALYLNKLLEERESLISNRDKTYRSLIKSFQTIKDADYEEPEGFKDVLRPYQKYGFKWLKTLSSAGFGGILADEMGLGKTLQAISLIESLKNDGEIAPALVVCPASLCYNWQEEINRFAPKLKSYVLSGTAAERKKALSKIVESDTKQKTSQAADIYITSYDSLRKDITLYEDLKFNVLILDEAQYIKNQKAGMTKAVKVLNGQHRFAMTGTPIENRLAELWSIFDYLMPGFLYNYKEFAGRFETPIAKMKDQNAAEKLKSMVRPFILRRLKSEVLKDLPEKLEEVRYVRFEDEQRKIYDGQVVKLKQIIESSNDNNEDKIRILAELTKLRQICCDPSLLFENYQGESAKRKGCLDLITSAISGGHRMLVFSQFTSMLELLEKDLKSEGIEYFKITGATPKEQRIKMVHEFNDGNVPVFLISLKAGGTGLNLTGADVVIHYDPWWNLAAQNQATDRAHRIGQKNKVTVYRMIMKDTIEEKILELQEAKKDLADAILEGESKSLFALSGEELMKLLGE
ncbi:MAG: DEAD/DEAH box helicase [Lachnospiraceae bacterium]|nr:DEAD/DEAH box helicase [Lachnospiraceae bacterium]